VTDGRTIWWSKDARWWAREGIVELADEFGADGPAVIDYLCGEAKLQNDAGQVKAGVKSVSRGCFVDVVTVGHVLSRAVALGVLDDMDLVDGRFTCRISGWAQDQDRGSAAFRKARQRARDSAQESEITPENTPGQTVTSHGESRSVTVGHAESHTGQDRTEETSSSKTSSPIIEHPDGERLCLLLADLIVANDERAKVQPQSKGWRDAMRLLIDADGRAPGEVEQVIRWCQADDFWRSNILSASKLREKFPMLRGQMARDAGRLASVGSRAPTAASLDRLGGTA
jgi:hypothetical protein